MRKPKKRGPNGDTLKINDDWKSAVKKALDRRPPESGWPERTVKERKRRKNK